MLNAAQRHVLVLVDWGGGGPADVDHDGAVGMDDLIVVLSAWTG